MCLVLIFNIYEISTDIYTILVFISVSVLINGTQHPSSYFCRPSSTSSRSLIHCEITRPSSLLWSYHDTSLSFLLFHRPFMPWVFSRYPSFQCLTPSSYQYTSGLLVPFPTLYKAYISLRRHSKTQPHPVKLQTKNLWVRPIYTLCWRILVLYLWSPVNPPTKS